jgi:hypothetical protein
MLDNELFVPILGVITLVVVIAAIAIGMKLEGRIPNPDRSYKPLESAKKSARS